ncbi:dynein axonemal heavy chain 1-like [Montipora capricornis]|uniref:dynein axonemal heavy chain 1-like n=1 Tax=Montipora capricornis TaxID=246305 RepID=UPI0035F13EAE
MELRVHLENYLYILLFKAFLIHMLIGTSRKLQPHGNALLVLEEWENRILQGLHPLYQDLSRVCNNLHVVLCMSTVGDCFHTHRWMFLSLVNCCTIDWFTEWSS